METAYIVVFSVFVIFALLGIPLGRKFNHYVKEQYPELWERIGYRSWFEQTDGGTWRYLKFIFRRKDKTFNDPKLGHLAAMLFWFNCIALGLFFLSSLLFVAMLVVDGK